MCKFKILTISMILLACFMYLPDAFALNICLDNVTLQKNMSLQVGNSSAENIVLTKDCEFGCNPDLQDCNGNSFYAFLILIIGIIGTLCFIYWIVKKK